MGTHLGRKTALWSRKPKSLGSYDLSGGHISNGLRILPQTPPLKTTFPTHNALRMNCTQKRQPLLIELMLFRYTHAVLLFDLYLGAPQGQEPCSWGKKSRKPTFLMLECSCNLNTGEVETGWFLAFVGQLGSLNGWVPYQMRGPVSNNQTKQNYLRWTGLEEQHSTISSGFNMNTHRHTHTNPCTHAKKEWV